MKDNNFIIKVSDLLNKPGTKDEYLFENKYIDEIDIIDNGLSGSLILNSISSTSIITNLINLKGKINFTCDICGNIFCNDINIKNHESSYTLNEDYNEFEYLIDKISETIDYKDFILQTIYYYSDTIKKCKNCKKTNEIDEKDFINFESNKIIWKN